MKTKFASLNQKNISVYLIGYGIRIDCSNDESMLSELKYQKISITMIENSIILVVE